MKFTNDVPFFLFWFEVKTLNSRFHLTILQGKNIYLEPWRLRFGPQMIKKRLSTNFSKNIKGENFIFEGARLTDITSFCVFI